VNMARAWSEKEDSELAYLADSGINRVDIASRLDRSMGAVEARAIKLGVPVATASRARRHRRWRASWELAKEKQ
jgi:hypothetical protein